MPEQAFSNSAPRGERSLIERIAARLPLSAGQLAVPFGDDMAALSAARPDLLWTTDMLMDGVDFQSARHAWRQIGRKAMAVNLSDCAAMGCTPVSALCAVALNDRLSMENALELLDGVLAQGREFDCPLVGGDMNSWSAPTVITITVAGECQEGPPVRRAGARPGDFIFVSGKLGGSILGRHLTPAPRIALSRQLLRSARPNAMIDISDGLAVDLAHICAASGCGAILDESELVHAIHDDAQTLARQDGLPALQHALQDGEDFELIVIAGGALRATLLKDFALLPIGVTTPGSDLKLRKTDGTVIDIEPLGWEHFR